MLKLETNGFIKLQHSTCIFFHFKKTLTGCPSITDVILKPSLVPPALGEIGRSAFVPSPDITAAFASKSQAWKALGIGRAWPRLQVGWRKGRSAITGQVGCGEGPVTRLHTDGQRSGVCTKQPEVFTVDSSGNRPAYEDREQTHFSLGQHKEQITGCVIWTNTEEWVI